jgi:pyrroline-5-carboxylate reductase
MATAISGSGPAYYYMVMEAMVDSAVHMGFSRDIARTLVLQTMKVSLTPASHFTSLLGR